MNAQNLKETADRANEKKREAIKKLLDEEVHGLLEQARGVAEKGEYWLECGILQEAVRERLALLGFTLVHTKKNSEAPRTWKMGWEK